MRGKKLGVGSQEWITSNDFDWVPAGSGIEVFESWFAYGGGGGLLPFFDWRLRQGLPRSGRWRDGWLGLGFCQADRMVDGPRHKILPRMTSVGLAGEWD